MKLLTVRDVALLLKLDVGTVYHWAALRPLESTMLEIPCCRHREAHC
jgi:hypothetical protein